MKSPHAVHIQNGELMTTINRYLHTGSARRYPHSYPQSLGITQVNLMARGLMARLRAIGGLSTAIVGRVSLPPR